MEQSTVKLNCNSLNMNFLSSLSGHFNENTFSDVTLVSDDQIQFHAHKFVLSACSPVLKDLLVSNIHPHPLLYLRGVSHKQLKSLIKLMYFGEASLNQEFSDKNMFLENSSDSKEDFQSSD